MNFAELHSQNEPLLVANVWDAVSAISAQNVGYQALGTSTYQQRNLQTNPYVKY